MFSTCGRVQWPHLCAAIIRCFTPRYFRQSHVHSTGSGVRHHLSFSATWDFQAAFSRAIHGGASVDAQKHGLAGVCMGWWGQNPMLHSEDGCSEEYEQPIRCRLSLYRRSSVDHPGHQNALRGENGVGTDNGQQVLKCRPEQVLDIMVTTSVQC